ncbi:ABC transporter permease [Pusillimonas sp. ANT_WB101]|uniref:ABC transporter permease n=1 Tax=Pusillimonas sp. ANT_WB101 TaxID=2597356 RepID=UPI0011F06FAA|nr:ABC transporter permease [Pusillimonas sp. ANT_WB101]KAA0892575.1 ABC transporter permease [Pusillimonas sp. ANT_WB101]
MTARISTLQLSTSSSIHADLLIRRINKLALAVVSIGALLFLLLPALIVIPMSFSESTSLRFPPEGFSFRWYIQVFSDPLWISAIKTSVVLALISSSLALILGSLAAYGLTRGTFKGRDLLQSNFISPLIIPAVILSVALYLALAFVGLLGSFAGLLIAHTILGVPYVVLIMSVAIRSFDSRIEQVAFTLGASWHTMLLRVLLPNLLPSALAAWIFAFVTSFDEVVVTKFIAGTYETVPKKMFNELVLQVNPVITALATVLIVISLILIAIVAKLNQKARANTSYV